MAQIINDSLYCDKLLSTPKQLDPQDALLEMPSIWGGFLSFAGSLRVQVVQLLNRPYTIFLLRGEIAMPFHRFRALANLR